MPFLKVPQRQNNRILVVHVDELAMLLQEASLIARVSKPS